MKSILKRILLTSVLASSGFAVCAQGMTPMNGPGPEGMQARKHGPDAAKMQERITRHLTAFKSKLKISADQEAAWSSFSNSMKPPANMSQMRPDRVEMDKLSTPERLDKMRALRTLHQAEMDKRLEAVKVFYAVLTPEQKKIFDTEHSRLARKFDHRGRHGEHGMMGEHGKP